MQNESTIRGNKVKMPLREFIDRAGDKLEVPKPLRDYIFDRESGFEHYDSSGQVKVGHKANGEATAARGVGQLVPGTAQRHGVDINNPADNAYGGLKEMKRLYDIYLQKTGRPDKAALLTAAAYNAGEGAVEKYGTVPPYKETQDYVRGLARHLKQNPIGPVKPDAPPEERRTKSLAPPAPLGATPANEPAGGSAAQDSPSLPAPPKVAMPQADAGPVPTLALNRELAPDDETQGLWDQRSEAAFQYWLGQENYHDLDALDAAQHPSAASPRRRFAVPGSPAPQKRTAPSNIRVGGNDLYWHARITPEEFARMSRQQRNAAVAEVHRLVQADAAAKARGLGIEQPSVESQNAHREKLGLKPVEAQKGHFAEGQFAPDVNQSPAQLAGVRSDVYAPGYSRKSGKVEIRPGTTKTSAAKQPSMMVGMVQQVMNPSGPDEHAQVREVVRRQVAREAQSWVQSDPRADYTPEEMQREIERRTDARVTAFAEEQATQARIQSSMTPDDHAKVKRLADGFANEPRFFRAIDLGLDKSAMLLPSMGAGMLRMIGSMTGSKNVMAASDEMRKQAMIRGLAQEKAASEGLSSPEQKIAAGAQLISDVIQLAALSEVMGPTKAMSLSSGLGSLGQGSSYGRAAVEAGKGALFGEMFKGAQVLQPFKGSEEALKRLASISTELTSVGVGTYTIERGFGASHGDALRAAIHNTALSGLLRATDIIKTVGRGAGELGEKVLGPKPFGTGEEPQAGDYVHVRMPDGTVVAGEVPSAPQVTPEGTVGLELEGGEAHVAKLLDVKIMPRPKGRLSTGEGAIENDIQAGSEATPTGDESSFTPTGTRSREGQSATSFVGGQELADEGGSVEASPQVEAEATEVKPISHPDPKFDGKVPDGETPDGKAIFINPENKTGVSVVTPRAGESAEQSQQSNGLGDMWETDPDVLRKNREEARPIAEQLRRAKNLFGNDPPTAREIVARPEWVTALEREMPRGSKLLTVPGLPDTVPPGVLKFLAPSGEVVEVDSPDFLDKKATGFKELIQRNLAVVRRPATAEEARSVALLQPTSPVARPENLESSTEDRSAESPQIVPASESEIDYLLPGESPRLKARAREAAQAAADLTPEEYKARGFDKVMDYDIARDEPPALAPGAQSPAMREYLARAKEADAYHTRAIEATRRGDKEAFDDNTNRAWAVDLKTSFEQLSDEEKAQVKSDAYNGALLATFGGARSRGVDQPTATETKSSVKKEKIDPRTGLTDTQENYLAGALEDYAERHFIKTENYPGGKGKDEAVEFLAHFGKANKEALYSRHGEKETIKVPGDGEFTISNVEGANRLHQKITGKPIDGLPKEQGASVSRLPSQRPYPKSQPTTADNVEFAIKHYGGAKNALGKLEDQWRLIQDDPELAEGVDESGLLSVINALREKVNAERSVDEVREPLADEVNARILVHPAFEALKAAVDRLAKRAWAGDKTSFEKFTAEHEPDYYLDYYRPQDTGSAASKKINELQRQIRRDENIPLSQKRGGGTDWFAIERQAAAAQEAAEQQRAANGETYGMFFGPDLGVVAEGAQALYRKLTGQTPEKGKFNFSGIGYLESWFRNLAQVQRADPKVHSAALEAVGATTRASLAMRKTAYEIQKLLGEEGWHNFRAFAIEDRLRGIEERWRGFADAAQNVSDEDIQSWYKGSKTNPYSMRDVIQKLEGYQSAEEFKDEAGLDQKTPLAGAFDTLIAAGNYDAARAYMNRLFTLAADSTAHTLDDTEYTLYGESSKMAQAIGIYKQNLERQLAESHMLNEGVFSDALGPNGIYYPLVPLDEAGNLRKRASGRSAAQWKKPKNLQNAFATGQAPDYDATAEALAGSVDRAMRRNATASLIKTLLKQGMARKLKKTEADQRTFEYQGETLRARTLVVGDARVIMKDGRKIHQSPARMVIPEAFHDELKEIIENKDYSPQVVFQLIQKVTGLGLAGPLDAVFHTANLLSAVVANTPYAGTDWVSKTAGNTPLTKLWTTIINVGALNMWDDEAAAAMEHLSRLGVVPPELGKVASGWTSKGRAYARMTGAKAKYASLGPMLYGPAGVHARTSYLFYKLVRHMNPDATDQEHFDAQKTLGLYNRKLQGKLGRFFKATTLLPFWTANSTMWKNGVKMYLRMLPLLGQSKALRAPIPTSGMGRGRKASLWTATNLLNGVGGIVAMWALLHWLLTDKTVWNDSEARFLELPVPKKHRHDPAVDFIYGKNEKTAYVGLGYLNPLAERGGKALGLGGAFNAYQSGASSGQQGEEAEKDIANSVMHMFTSGPLVHSGIVLGTGQEPYIESLRDVTGKRSVQFKSVVGRTPPGMPTLEKSAVKGVSSINSFFAKGAEGLGFIQQEHVGLDNDEVKKPEDQRYNVLARLALDMAFPRLFKPARDVSQSRKFYEKQDKLENSLPNISEGAEYKRFSGELRRARKVQEAGQETPEMRVRRENLEDAEKAMNAVWEKARKAGSDAEKTRALAAVEQMAKRAESGNLYRPRQTKETPEKRKAAEARTLQRSVDRWTSGVPSGPARPMRRFAMPR